MSEFTADWDLYTKGLAYQTKINLLAQTNKNYRFASNDHWKGVKGADKLTLVTIPLIQQVNEIKTAVVMSDSLKMKFGVQGISDDTEDENEQEILKMAQQLSDYADTSWENLKMDNMNEDGLLDSAITGDLISFWLWDETINAGNGAWGEMLGERIDNVNYFPDDPTLDEINNAYGPVQTGMILSFVKSVEDERRYAKANGVNEEDLKKIVADADCQQNQLGDKNNQDLNKENGNCIVLLRLWKELEEVKGKVLDPETGKEKEIITDRIWHIKARRSTREVVTRKEWDTGGHRYWVAGMHWRKKKGSAYGESEVKSLIPNQLVINKLASLIATWITLHGFPKVLFDKTRIPSWTNNLHEAIAVNGTDTGGVGGAAMYMVPAQISSAVQNFLVWLMETTKKAFGANEAILGEAAGNNYSANALNSQNAIVPLNGQKHRFYNYVEDIGLIWLDIWLSKYREYPNRNLEINKKDANGNVVKQVVPFDAKKLDGVRLKLKIDVGPSTQWSEARMTQAIMDMMDKQWITLVEGLERLPDNVIPDKQSLIESRNGQGEADKKLLYELVAEFVKQLPSEAQQQMQGMTVEQVKQQVEQMLTGNQSQEPTQPVMSQQPQGGNVNG